MAAAKGQNTVITVKEAGKPVGQIDSITSFEYTIKVSTEELGCLGEKTDRIFANFKGVEFTIEMVVQNAEALMLFQRYCDKAKDIVTTTEFEVSTSIEFPDGDKLVVSFPNAFFGDLQVSASGREENIKVTLPGRASTYNQIKS